MQGSKVRLGQLLDHLGFLDQGLSRSHRDIENNSSCLSCVKHHLGPGYLINRLRYKWFPKDGKISLALFETAKRFRTVFSSKRSDLSLGVLQFEMRDTRLEQELGWVKNLPMNREYLSRPSRPRCLPLDHPRWRRPHKTRQSRTRWHPDNQRLDRWSDNCRS